MLRQCFLEVGCEYGHTWQVTYLFLSFNSDSINTVCLSWNIKVFRKISQFRRASAFFLVIFGKLLRACFIVPGPAKLKIVRVRLVRNDVSVPFASCPSNRRGENWNEAGFLPQWLHFIFPRRWRWERTNFEVLWFNKSEKYLNWCIEESLYLSKKLVWHLKMDNLSLERT